MASIILDMARGEGGGRPRSAVKGAGQLAQTRGRVRVVARLTDDLLAALRALPPARVDGVEVRLSVTQRIIAAVETLLAGAQVTLPTVPASGKQRQWWLPPALVERLDAAYPGQREQAIVAAVERHLKR